MTHLYWIRNAECQRIETDGYVGVSKDAALRFKQHLKKNSAIPTDAWVEIIFEGTREECFSKEHTLRPKKGIGWNRAAGGAHGFKQGFTHSEEARTKLKEAWTADRKATASVWKTEQNHLLKGQVRPSQATAMIGEKNPTFGKPRSEETRAKISSATKGHEPPNKQELYCRICRARAPQSILRKYHNKCFKV